MEGTGHAQEATTIIIYAQNDLLIHNINNNFAGVVVIERKVKCHHHRWN